MWLLVSSRQQITPDHIIAHDYFIFMCVFMLHVQNLFQ